jgi:hypothetical protein
MEKEHLEILLEDINSKFNLVLGGHDALRSEIREARDESNSKHDHTAFMIGVLNKKIDAVAADLSAHRADTEAHHRVYQVKETEEKFPG